MTATLLRLYILSSKEVLTLDVTSEKIITLKLTVEEAIHLREALEVFIDGTGQGEAWAKQLAVRLYTEIAE